MTGDSI